MVPRATDFQTGRVVLRTGHFLAVHLPLFLAFSAIGMAPLLYMAIDGGQHPARPVSFASRTAAFQIFFVIFVILVFAVLAAIVYAVQALLVARALADPDDGENIRPAVSSLGPAVAIGLLSTCCICLGLVLVIPGLFLMAAWSAAIPACMMERLGVMASIQRSETLTKGCRLKILGLMGMILALWLMLEFVAGLTLSGLKASPAYLVSDDVLQWANLVVAVMVTAAATAAIYSELRLVKEGVGPQQLAAAFD